MIDNKLGNRILLIGLIIVGVAAVGALTISDEWKAKEKVCRTYASVGIDDCEKAWARRVIDKRLGPTHTVYRVKVILTVGEDDKKVARLHSVLKRGTCAWLSCFFIYDSATALP